MKTKRLDILLFERGLAKSREQAQALILAGEVWSGEKRLEKPGVPFDTSAPLEVRSRSLKFVSRAGEKLEHGLNTFQINLSQRVCLDVGASTGGFTDCMLRSGARHVFAVDVGYGQLDTRLRNDPRVTTVERTNARYLGLSDLEALSPLAREISFVSMDVSFISLEKLILPLAKELPSAKEWLVLFKPQFEVGRDHIGKGGKVRHDEAVEKALVSFRTFLENQGFQWLGGPEKSPLEGKKSGNLEYLIHYAVLSR